MIPKRLRLQNFLSYRECEIDFSGLHLAVLCGNNGDGKSALLDAITWALWGKARGGKEDQRIHASESHMLVDLEFEVEGHRYRVVRKRAKGGPGKVDLFRLDGADWTALTGGTNKQTDDEIEHLLRMDHETFLNSALLAQGKADEFTKRTAGERKAVLGKVLGLERYEGWAAEAANRRKIAAGDGLLLADRIARAEPQVEELPPLQQQLAAREEQLEALRPRIEAQQAEVLALRAAAQVYAAAEDALHQAEQALAAAEAERDRIARDIASLSKALAAEEKVVSRAVDIRGRKEELDRARAAEREQLEKQAEHGRWAQERTAAEGEIATAEATLQTKLEAACVQVAQREAEEAQLASLEAQEGALSARDQELDRARGLVDEARGLAADAKNKAVRLRQQASGWQATIAEIEAKEKQLRGARAACPVCKQTLTKEHAQQVRADFEKERTKLKADAADAISQANKALQECRARENQAAELEKGAEADRRALVSDEKRLAARLDSARQAAALLPNLRKAAVELQRTLAGAKFAPEARRRLAEATRQQKAVAFADPDHAVARKQVKALSSADEELAGLQMAETRVSMYQEQLAGKARDQVGSQEAAKVAAEKVQARRAALDRLVKAAPRLRGAEDGLNCLEQARDEGLSDLGRLQGAIESRRLLVAQLAEDTDRLRSTQEEEGVYGELAVGFGKDGVQALLIGQAIPDIERAANAILERTAAGRIQVQLELQKTVGSGKHQKLGETLDIRISDDLGTRDYEMYSGGEKFRVDFALRIALSRLLAGRAGASLPTLIVDEGFGSQDSQGVDRLVESLNTISDEFRLILVVTHLDSLKDRFDQRIEVTKDPERGSLAVVR